MKRLVFTTCLAAMACSSQNEAGSGSWSKPSALPFEARTGAVTVWTGSEMFVWGGLGPCGLSVTCGDGGRYEPVADSWTLVPPDPGVPGRFGHSAVWSGTDILIWGGKCGDKGDQPCTAGARYSPSSNQWSPLLGSTPPGPRSDHTATWTGAEMVVWGGRDPATDAMLADGALYDPTTALWRPMSSAAAPSARRYQSAIWTGSEVIVWGGDGGDRFLSDGARYDPVADRWTPLPTAGAPSARYAHSVVWTGTEMIIWGGQGCGDAPGGGPGPCGDGARYAPATDSWTALSQRDAPLPRAGHSAVWTGSQMIVWGSSFCEGGPCAAGGLYDPAADRWRPMTTQGQPALRGDHGAVWTGTVMVIWGGFSAEFPLPDLARYTP